MKLIIFDLDGTLVTTRSGEKFRQTATDWKWLPGRLERCGQLVSDGVKLAIATNQAGVAFPWSNFNEAEIYGQIQFVGNKIQASITTVCYTTPNEKALPQYHYPNDPRRKPNPGMLLECVTFAGCEKGDALIVERRTVKVTIEIYEDQRREIEAMLIERVNRMIDAGVEVDRRKYQVSVIYTELLDFALSLVKQKKMNK